MFYTHRLHPLAHQDIIDAYEWYENQQKGLGDKFTAALQKKILAIEKNPTIFGSKYKQNFREASVSPFPFIIVFKVYKKEKKVFISSVHHIKKHPKTMFRK